MPGGTSEVKPPNEEVQQLLLSVKDQVEEKLGRSVSQFKLLSYKTQVVAGMNYFAKSDQHINCVQIDIGEEDVVHVRVYKDLKQKVSLHSLQHPKAHHDDLTYF
ncbi:cystatin-B isoform X1 [Cherax quadricarinatus]|uniref:cystatin-B isoform X1 n=1 Tax=Cherax quadricarinatus TaxID=27406 RepID=UPI002379828A|nr:cystatin-B-like isoform X1 [Cherax quadricarinatus]